ncbi:MAG: T9SS type A sorting domain-containing protein [Urechidicola sp.]|nr:T9SS type A sorting domain-containing protein [Urechidicola sp.]
MLRKLLLLLLIGFAFTEINAQTFISYSPGCGSNSFEFEQVADINGKVAYASMAVPTGNFNGLNITDTSGGTVPDPVGSSIVTIDWDGAQWVFASGGTTVFTNSFAGALVPDTGWVSDGAPCGLTIILTLYDNSTAVLPVDREEFSDIKVYPNPSTGFINISNLKENSRVVISNIAGQVVKDVVVGMNDNRIDIQDLTQGFYFVELEGKKTIKLLKR